MADFTLKAYERLVRSLIAGGFTFLTFEEYLKNPAEKSVVLRHDVDLLPENAVVMAEIEARLGVVASYHFRVSKQSFDRTIVRRIVSLGHEIAYHYEDLYKSMKAGEYIGEKGPIEKFRENLEIIRQIAPVKVISMHGNPRSGHDSRDIWTEYSYRDFGIVCEPYFDIDYSQVLYLTDTGRTWDGSSFNVRDRVTAGFGSTSGKPLNEMIHFKSTHEIVAAANCGRLPNHLILSAHPQRWTDHPAFWLKELLWQNTKNIIKFLLIRSRV
jgi:hypothetical protein